MTDLFLKDSIYCAIGLGSHDLYGAVDFDSWLNGQLSQEVQNADPKYATLCTPHLMAVTTNSNFL